MGAESGEVGCLSHPLASRSDGRFLSHIRRPVVRCIFLLVAVVSSLMFVIPTFGAEQPDDSQSFIDGFEAYKKKDFNTSQGKLREVLVTYPDSPLRDVVLFWLARSYYKNGNQREAARHMSTFAREYPDSPLLLIVEDDLKDLVARYEKGELLPALAGKAISVGS